MMAAITVLVLLLVVVGLVYRHQRGYILAARDSADDAGRLAAKADHRAADALARISALSKRLGADK